MYKNFILMCAQLLASIFAGCAELKLAVVTSCKAGCSRNGDVCHSWYFGILPDFQTAECPETQIVYVLLIMLNPAVGLLGREILLGGSSWHGG